MSSDSGDNRVQAAYELALDYERTKTACSQCVIAALQKVFNVGDDNLFRDSFGLAGGLGCTCSGTCGALAGGVLILNSLYGRTKEQFEQQGPSPLQSPRCAWEEKGMVLAQKLASRFEQEYGSIICGDVQTKIMGFKADLWTKEGLEKMEKAGGHYDKCPVVVANAARWTAEILTAEGL
jgi:C_GCAxxG_C_C family probable redox protein